MKRARGDGGGDDEEESNVHGDNPLVERGEEMQIPADWETRPGHLAGDFDCFEVEGFRFYHHVNGLFIVYLAASHPLFSHPSRSSLVFSYTSHVLPALGITGKSRKGTPRTQPASQVAHITLPDGTSYPILARIKSFVVELNPALQKDPAPLLELERDDNYVIILQPKSEREALKSLGHPLPERTRPKVVEAE